MTHFGFSLAWAYLMGDEGHIFRRLFGPVDAGLALLREHGVTHIEMRAASPATPAADVLRVAHRIWDAGLAFSIHGGLPALPLTGDWREVYPALAVLAEPLRQRGEEVVIPLHAYQAREGDADVFLHDSILAFKTLLARCDQEGLPYRFAVEINRKTAKKVDPAITYDKVYALWQQVSHPRLGICWDFGHAFDNVRQGIMNDPAPDTFVKQVIHTHIHDLGPTGKTHWPLTERRLSLQAYVAQLRQAGYQGIWNLELSPERYADESNVAGRLLESIAILQAAVDSVNVTTMA